jgi:hypothetical protein
MSQRQINIAIVGLGFGAEFLPIYQRHPNTQMYAICQRTQQKLDQIGDAFAIEKRYTSFEELIKDPKVDAVHINSPIHLHAPQSIAALKAGKHVACTVPAATTVEECKQIVKAAQKAKKNYMMMETVVYSREFLYVRELRDQGKLGTHTIPARLASPEHGRLARLLGRSPAHALRHPLCQPLPGHGEGGSRLRLLPGLRSHREQLLAKYGSPFSFETAHCKIRNQDLAF